MPRFNIEAEFGLTTEIEADFYGHNFDAYNVEDSSSFGTAYVEIDGGSITFEVEAEDEADAERTAEGVIYDGYEMEDRDGLTWAVQSTSISVEPVEMSKDEALTIIRAFLDSLERAGRMEARVREAFDVILQDI